MTRFQHGRLGDALVFFALVVKIRHVPLAERGSISGSLGALGHVTVRLLRDASHHSHGDASERLVAQLVLHKYLPL